MNTTNHFVFDNKGQRLDYKGEIDIVIDPVELLARQDGDSLTGRIEKIAKEFKQANAIGIRFEKFTDGRSYSIAARLREAGFSAELHALGEINQEIVFLLKRVGFTHFHIPDPGASELAENILHPFAGHYQGAQDGTLSPWQQKMI